MVGEGVEGAWTTRRSFDSRDCGQYMFFLAEIGHGGHNGA